MSAWGSWGATALLLMVGFGSLVAGGGILYASIVEEEPFLALWTAIPWVVGAIAIAWGLQRILPALHVRELTFDLAPSRHGQPITGQLTLTPWFGATIHRIDLQLHLVEGDAQDQHEVVSPLASLPLSDRRVIQTSLTVPFSIPFPHNGPASFEDHDLYVRYLLRARILLPYRLTHQEELRVTVLP